MSNEQAKKIEHTVGWFTQAVIIGLLSTVVYFVKDLHSEYKEDHKKIETHELRITLLESKNP